MIKAGQVAPGFGVADQTGELVHLSEYRGENNVVLYFYPKDDTPGCTVEAIDFTARAQEFADLNTQILGVSKDDCDSHSAFIDKHKLNVTLLADTDGSLCEKYGVWQEKEKNGEKRMGIVRSTFIIDKSGTVQHALYGVEAKGHADLILQLVKELG